MGISLAASFCMQRFYERGLAASVIAHGKSSFHYQNETELPGGAAASTREDQKNEGKRKGRAPQSAHGGPTEYWNRGAIAKLPARNGSGDFGGRATSPLIPSLPVLGKGYLKDFTAVASSSFTSKTV